jgi:mannose-6-phosphate isomerase
MASTPLQFPLKGSLRLGQRRVEKPWGRSDLSPTFGGSTNHDRIGEIWFEHPSRTDLPLLVKYIFTSEKLSIQVHPDDVEARARGLAEGKSECWYVVDAKPGATIGLGLCQTVSRDALRNAALDGSIDSIMNWIPVSPGDFFYVPAGTVHTIGAGLTLLEFQQASDVTYRLFDYGRPRELHLDDGIAVATPGPPTSGNYRPAAGPADVVLANTPHFSLVRAASGAGIPAALTRRWRWVMPLEGSAAADGETATAGECLLARPDAPLLLSRSAIVLVGAAGPF